MSPAAKARAIASARSASTQDEDAAAKVVVQPVRARSSNDLVSVPSPRPGRYSPASQRRRFLSASTSMGGIDDTTEGDTPLSPDAQKVVLQLQADRRRLKDIKSTERKVEAKRDMLDAYRSWCAGILSAGAGERSPLDQIFTMVMMWMIDVGDYVTALPMLEHTVKYGLAMPSHVNRDPLTFAIDEICEEALRQYDLDPHAAFDAAVLPMLQDMADTYDIDLHDEVEAKLFKAVGRAIMAGADLEDETDLRQRREQTLKHYLRALELHDRCGVKKDIDRLKRDLNKMSASDTPPASPPSADG